MQKVLKTPSLFHLLLVRDDPVDRQSIQSQLSHVKWAILQSTAKNCQDRRDSVEYDEPLSHDVASPPFRIV